MINAVRKTVTKDNLFYALSLISAVSVLFICLGIFFSLLWESRAAVKEFGFFRFIFF